eukprot:TRINITY_DN25678_c0_g1_i1.p1 TRINITY_DN25678_c0_g1~~TRINITY_DN25678_c0_g1_i1.p1  ORF type:complete len:402 (-),score=69.06 TRINITY_DN25678_c0_g1_i1:120-1325(-)
MSDALDTRQWELGLIACGASALLATTGMQWRILAPSLLGKKKWLLDYAGLLCWMTGQGLGQMAVALAPATLCACLNFSGSLVANALLAPLILNETLTARHAQGVFLLACGASLCTLFASHAAQEYTLERFLELLGRPPFPLVAALCYGGVAVVLGRSFCQRRRLDILGFAFVYAVCGATDLIVTKFALQLVSAWATAPSADREAAAAPCGLGVVMCFMAAMIVLHVACFFCQVSSSLYGDALQNIPLLLGTGTLAQVVLAGSFFNEFAGFDAPRCAGFCVGLLGMLLGLRVTTVAATDGEPAGKVAESLDDVQLDEALLAALDELSPVAEEGEVAALASPGMRHRFKVDMLCIMDIGRTNLCSQRSRELCRRCHQVGRACSVPDSAGMAYVVPPPRAQSVG